MTTSKLTTGNNDRPKHETIAHTGEGIPDDSAEPVDVTVEKLETGRQKLTGTPSVVKTPNMPYDVDHAEGRADR